MLSPPNFPDAKIKENNAVPSTTQIMASAFEFNRLFRKAITFNGFNRNSCQIGALHCKFDF